MTGPRRRWGVDHGRHGRHGRHGNRRHGYREGEDAMQTETFEQVKVDSVVVREQVRRHFDKAALAELTASVKAHGILQPLLGRRVNGHVELVLGERRLRAARAAGLEAVPVTLREMDDRTVAEIQTIENVQRQDLHPFEEAAGYKRLVEEHGYDAPKIAARIGKSAGYVAKRLSLNRLSGKARALYDGGKVELSTALLLARIPENLQDSAAKEIGGRGSPMSHSDALHLINAHYMLSLKDAPFDTRCLKLVEAAGPCTKCLKRTGNQKELFDDVSRKDTCTDPACFNAKAEAHWTRRKLAIEASGGVVLEDKLARALAPYGYFQSNKYVKADVPCTFDKKHRTWAKLLGRHAPPVVVARLDGSHETRLYRQDHTLAAALKAAGVRVNLQDPAKERAKRAKKVAEVERNGRLAALAGDKAVAAILERAGRAKHAVAILRAVLGPWMEPYTLPDCVKERHGWKDEVAAKAELWMMTGDALAVLAIEVLLGANCELPATCCQGGKPKWLPMFAAVAEAADVDLRLCWKAAETDLKAEDAKRKAGVVTDGADAEDVEDEGGEP